MNHTVAYSATGKKLHKDARGRWVNSKGNRSKAKSYTKPVKKVKKAKKSSSLKRKRTVRKAKK